MAKSSLRIAFAGSGPFAEPVFTKLTENFDNITLILKTGTSESSEVVQIAKKNEIKVFEVANKSDFHQEIVNLEPDIVIVVSFGIIISKETLKLPPYSFINVHYSLLPKYRGPSPVQYTVLCGDKTSGLTFQIMAEKIDEGDILYQKKVSISGKETTVTLAKRMAELSAEKLPIVIKQYVGEDIKPRKQVGGATFSKIIQKSDGKIDWSESAEIIERKVRAYTPWPSAYTHWDGKLLKILEANVENIDSNEKIGTFIKLDSGPALTRSRSRSGMTGLYGIQTGKGTLLVKKLQLEGKKPLETSDFILGNSQIMGSILG